MDEKKQGQGVPPKKEPIGDVLKKYKEMRDENNLPKSPPQPVNPDTVITDSIPKSSGFNNEEFEKTMSRETDPDLMMSYEIVKLPSKGMFYKNGISEVNVEYMTSKDEDLLTTPSLIENGTVLEVLLKRKIKTKDINPEDLLSGDRNAVLLFLRSSSYGHEYTVQVSDPRTGKQFQSNVDLRKLKYKNVEGLPDEEGLFSVDIPMRKKTIKFRLLTSGEENILFKKAESIKEAMNQEFNDYNTMKLKAHIVSIGEKTDPTYISKFVDVMPALDALTIRKKILAVSPDVDMNYKFTAPDGYTFNAELTIGIDFFFPNT
jgi:hypothetical protein